MEEVNQVPPNYISVVFHDDWDVRVPIFPICPHEEDSEAFTCDVKTNNNGIIVDWCIPDQLL